MEAVVFWVFDRVADLLRLLWRVAGDAVYATLVLVIIFMPCMFLLATAVPAFLFAAREIPWPWKPLALPGVIAAHLLGVAGH